MCCMCDRVDSLLLFNASERAQTVGQPSILLTQAQTGTCTELSGAVRRGPLLCRKSEFRERWVLRSWRSILHEPLLPWFKSVILKWIMIECPSITFPGVRCGRSGLEVGEPHTASHIHLCASLSDICGSVYNTTCIFFKYISSCLFCTLIYSGCLPMVSGISFIEKTIKTFLKMKMHGVSDPLC